MEGHAPFLDAIHRKEWIKHFGVVEQTQGTLCFAHKGKDRGASCLDVGIRRVQFHCSAAVRQCLVEVATHKFKRAHDPVCLGIAGVKLERAANVPSTLLGVETRQP